jgi:hypothetical protein
MPILRFDILEGRSEDEITALLAAAHRAVLRAFSVPLRDRYQIVHEHRPGRMRVEDTGLGFARSDRVVLLQVVTRPRTEAEKTDFYRELCAELQRACGLAPADLVVSLVENTDADWSFGDGRAQFLTGELASERNAVVG